MGALREPPFSRRIARRLPAAREYGRCEFDTGMLVDSRKVELTRNPGFECGKQGLRPEVLLPHGLSVACRRLDISGFADCNGSTARQHRRGLNIASSNDPEGQARIAAFLQGDPATSARSRQSTQAC